VKPCIVESDHSPGDCHAETHVLKFISASDSQVRDTRKQILSRRQMTVIRVVDIFSNRYLLTPDVDKGQ
jgi:hypothetical protein